MAYSFRHTNPRLVGAIVKEKIRCGKQNCRCVKEKRLHKWYYYLYWRDYQNKGKLRKQYIRRLEVQKLRKKIKSMKTKDMEEKVKFRFYLKLFRQMFPL